MKYAVTPHLQSIANIYKSIKTEFQLYEDINLRGGYIMRWIKRLLLDITTVSFATVSTFLIMRMMVGDPVENMAISMVHDQGIDYESAYRSAKAMLNYDPDVPILTQYTKYLSGLMKGNLGQSLIYKRDVKQIIGEALPWTLFVLSISLLLSFFIGIFLGMYIAWKRTTILDPILSAYTAIVGSIPEFVIAFLLIVFFSVKLKWFPSRGAYSSSVKPGFNMPYFLDVLNHAVLPITAYVLGGIGRWALNMKANAVSVLGEDYIVSARARGLREKRIITRYVGRNAMLPLVTNLAISFGMIFGGSPLIERLFVYPGVGYYMSQSISSRDYIFLQVLFLLITVTVVLATVVAEILYPILDPRIRMEG